MCKHQKYIDNENSKMKIWLLTLMISLIVSCTLDIAENSLDSQPLSSLGSGSSSSRMIILKQALLAPYSKQEDSIGQYYINRIQLMNRIDPNDTGAFQVAYDSLKSVELPTKFAYLCSFPDTLIIKSEYYFRDDVPYSTTGSSFTVFDLNSNILAEQKSYGTVRYFSKETSCLSLGIKIIASYPGNGIRFLSSNKEIFINDINQMDLNLYPPR